MIKKVKNKKEDIDDKGTYLSKYRISKKHLFYTYLRIITFIAIPASLLSILSYKKIMFVPPTSIYDNAELGKYLFINIIIPFSLLFFTAVIMTWFILSQKDFKYINWLLQETWSRLLINFLLFITLIVGIIALLISFLPDSYYTVYGQYNMSRAQITLWNTTVFTMSFPLWIGYKEGWRSYKEIGATTTQGRYEEDLRKLEIKNSGQFWDKFVVNFYNIVTGADGHKPRGGYLWFSLVGTVGLTFLWIISTIIGLNYLIGLSVFLIMPAILGIFMTISKWADMRMTKRAPRLHPVRGPGYEGDYNPSSVGVRVFNRRG